MTTTPPPRVDHLIKGLAMLANGEHPYGTGPFDSRHIEIFADDARVLVDELERLREVDEAAHAYVRAGLCGNVSAADELAELIRVARRGF